MKLRISRKKLRTVRLLFYVGTAVMVLSLPIAGTGAKWWFALLVAGGAVGSIGSFQADSLYRCPRCGEKLLGSYGWKLFSWKPFAHCPCCGWPVEIEWIDEKEDTLT